MTLPRAFAVLVLAALVALEVHTLAGTEVAETTFDSGIFLRRADASPLELAFYRGVRPPTVPLLYQMVGTELEAIRALQSTLSVVAWFALGLALASLFRSRATRALALAVPCALSLTVPVNQWDGVVMSESIFLSLLVLVAALSIALVRQLVGGGRASGGLLALWFVAVLVFAGARDSSVYLLALLFAAGLVELVRRAWVEDEPAGVVALPLFLLSLAIGAGYTSMRASERWRTPLVNVILGRVLTDDDLRAEWARRYDLPRNALFEAQVGRYAWNRVPGGAQLRKELERSPALADVETWLRERGVSSYQRWLLIDAPLRSIAEAREGLLLGVDPPPPVGLDADGDASRTYSRGAGVTGWSAQLTRVLYAPVPWPHWIGLGALVAALLVLWRGGAARPPALAAAFLMVGALTQAFVAWHGDTAELERHTVVVGVLYRLALVALALGFVDALLERPARSRFAQESDASRTATAS